MLFAVDKHRRVARTTHYYWHEMWPGVVLCCVHFKCPDAPPHWQYVLLIITWWWWSLLCCLAKVSLFIRMWNVSLIYIKWDARACAQAQTVDYVVFVLTSRNDIDNELCVVIALRFVFGASVLKVSMSYGVGRLKICHTKLVLNASNMQ